MKRKFAYLMVMVILVTGCGGSPVNDSGQTEKQDMPPAALVLDESNRIQGQLTPEETTIESENLSISVDAHFMEEDVSISVTPVVSIPAPQGLEDLKITAYQIDVSEGYEGLYEVAIHYEPGDYEIGAGYYNEDTQEWEPVFFILDEANHQITILTDHFSTYGLFQVAREGRRSAILEGAYFEPFNKLGRAVSDYDEIVKEAIENNLEPGHQAINLANDWVGEWFTLSGVVFDLEGLMYGSDFLSDLSDAFGNVGLAMSLTRLAYDYSRGDQQAVAVNAFNTTQGLAISKLGTQAMKVSMLGVLAIDYSMDKLIDQVIGGREDVWYQAYALYYQKEQVRRPRDWYHRMREIHDHANSPQQFERMIEAELNRYTWLFWQKEDETWGIYQSEVMDQADQLGGGLNEALKTEIADYHKTVIMRDTLNPVFRRLEREIQREQHLAYLEEMDHLRKQFNRVVTLRIEEVAGDDGLKYAGYGVRFHPLNDNADVQDWTGRIGDDGKAQVQFTVMGHITAGMPREIRLYETREDMDNNNPAYSQNFTVEVPETTVKIQDEKDVYEFLLQSWNVSRLEEEGHAPEPHGGNWNIDCTTPANCTLTIEMPKDGKTGAVFMDGPAINAERNAKTALARAPGNTTLEEKPVFIEISSDSVSGRFVSFARGGYPVHYREVYLDFNDNAVRGRIDVFHGDIEYTTYPEFDYISTHIETIEFEGVIQ